MSCFRQNSTTGRYILEFADDATFSVQIRTIHRYWGAAFSGFTAILNALLCIAMIRTPTPQIKIKPMLVFNLLIDFVFASFCFVFPRNQFVGYNRSLKLIHGPVEVTDPRIARLLYMTLQAFGMISYYAVTYQFVYRWLLVKYGEQPRGRRLFGFLVFCLGFLAFSLYFQLSSTARNMTPEDYEDSIQLLRYYGHDFDLSSLDGAVKRPDQQGRAMSIIPLLMPLTTYLIILYCALATRRRLHQSKTQMSVITRRLNRAMDRTIVCMGVIPILTNFFSYFALPVMNKRCQGNAPFSLAFDTLMLSNAFISPLLTLIFIRPYRRGLWKLITCGDWTGDQKQTGGVVVLATDQSTPRTTFSHRQALPL